MADDFEVLSAVLDGELVEIEPLERALNDPAGRRMFVNFVDLRQLSTGGDSSLSAAFYRRASATGLMKPPSRGARRIPLPLAAAAVLVAMLLGSLINSTLVRQDSATLAPPEPTRVLRFEPGVDWR
jgi:hypothetical protein